ncbi:MAG: DUF2231 domain-containing protein, partial [Candidatus Manganitrophus sp.]|nr:DUF2231 domain-containing protein [Candidatus Manganitrophus sp.]
RLAQKSWGIRSTRCWSSFRSAFISFLLSSIWFICRPAIPFWFRMAYWTMLGGLVGNVAAAIPGFLDYLTLPPKTEARQIATYHMGIGVTLAILYFANLLLRDWGVIATNQQPWGVVILNLVGVLLIGLQGWLGGELVYKHGVGVEEKERAREERFRRVA